MCEEQKSDSFIDGLLYSGAWLRDIEKSFFSGVALSMVVARELYKG